MPLATAVTLSGKSAIVHLLGVVPVLANPAPPVIDKWGYTHAVAEQEKSGTSSSAGPAQVGIPASLYWVNGDVTCRPGEVPILAVVCFPNRLPGPGASPRAVALSQWRRLPIPAPVVRTAPPRGT
ncbi:hypothetical protein ACFQ07_33025, partial [Actinomadura adrarensis]